MGIDDRTVEEEKEEEKALVAIEAAAVEVAKTLTAVARREVADLKVKEERNESNRNNHK